MNHKDFSSSINMDSNYNLLMKKLKAGLNACTQDEILKWLHLIKNLISSSPSIDQNEFEELFHTLLHDLKMCSSDISSIRNNINQSHHYSQQIYNLMIENISIEWLSILTTEHFNTCFKNLFFIGSADDAFIALMDTVTKESKERDFRFQTCVSILEELICVEKLAEILQRQCHVNLYVSSITDPYFEKLVTSLCSFPEKMSNRLHHDNSEKFYPQKFYAMLSAAILKTFDMSHLSLSSNEDVSLQMVSNLIGKLCLIGAGEILMDKILPYCCCKVRTDYIWSRICIRVFTGVPARCLESVLVPLLKKLPWFGVVEMFLGDCVIENSTARMLICTKLLLHKSFENPKQLLQNIIGYLSQSDSRHHLYLEVFVHVLQVWGSSTSMRHIPARQHQYITQALAVCLGCLGPKDISAKKDDFLRLLMPGVQAHLESSDPNVRLLGMTFAKRLTHKLDPTGPQLEWEMDLTNDLVKDLLSFEDLSEDPGQSQEEIDSVLENDDFLRKEKRESLCEQIVDETSIDEELDSDDDLVPYDMSNDRKVMSCKPPKYIRECMEGLIGTKDNVEQVEVCLQHAESIIRKQTYGLEEIAAEFAKILLHLTECGGLVDFLKLRRRSLCALIVTCPVQVSNYLTSQFYERNSNLRQRMDILDALSDGAMELSQPEKTTKQQKERLVEDMSPVHEETWREIVQKRIESNTRRFSKGQRQPQPVATLSRFASVAGDFFYPLLVKVDKREPCLDMLGQDAALLYRLLYTLAIVIHSATHSPAVIQMGRTLLEFTWSLRTHFDQCVRQAVLTATTTVFLSVPAHAIMTELHSDVTETMAWLEDVIEKDSDTECQKQAAQALLILQEQIRKDVESGTVIK